MAPTVIIVGFISFPVAAWVIIRCAALFPDIVSGCIAIIKSSQQSTVRRGGAKSARPLNSQQSTVNSQQSPDSATEIDMTSAIASYFDVGSIFFVSILGETDNVIIAEVLAILDFNHHQRNHAGVFHAVSSIHGNVG